MRESVLLTTTVLVFPQPERASVGAIRRRSRPRERSLFLRKKAAPRGRSPQRAMVSVFANGDWSHCIDADAETVVMVTVELTVPVPSVTVEGLTEQKV